MEHACLPKERTENGLRSTQAPWPMFGLMKALHLDNGAEFHSEALHRGCSEYGITLNYRPPARPHFGGHIERLIGTVMGRLHLLPGTSDASPAHRGGYQAEREASMTLAEFAEWLSLEIAGRYHHTVHRMLGSRAGGGLEGESVPRRDARIAGRSAAIPDQLSTCCSSSLATQWHDL